MYLVPLISEIDGMEAVNLVVRAYLRARVPACKIAGTVHSAKERHRLDCDALRTRAVSDGQFDRRDAPPPARERPGQPRAAAGIVRHQSASALPQGLAQWTRGSRSDMFGLKPRRAWPRGRARARRPSQTSD